MDREQKNSIDEVDMEELDEAEPRAGMVNLAMFGLIIVLVVVIAVIVVFVKSDKNTHEEASMGETVTDEYLEKEIDVVETTIEVENTTEEEGITEPKETGVEEISVEETEPSEENTIMEFSDVVDTVTSKDVTNLRMTPSTLDEDNIVSQLLNGEEVSRTGINVTTGWSRLIYNGQTVYAVSNFLTTDLDYKTPVVVGDVNRVTTLDGRIIIFVDCDDYVTPKEYVNLRVEPSTTEGEVTVRCQIKNGDKVKRTGYSLDSGWSRVEYNGEILYVVSSMIYSTEE